MSRKPICLEDIPIRETLPAEPPAPPVRDVVARDKGRRQAARRHWFHHPVSGTLNALAFQLLKLLPSDWTSNAGPALLPFARLSFKNKPFFKRIRRNFAALTAGRLKNAADRTTGVEKWWENTARTRSEYCIVNRLSDEARVTLEGLDNLNAARSASSPLIFCSVHLSNWELLIASLEKGPTGPVAGPFQPEPNRFVNRIVYALRKQRGSYMFPPGQKSAIRLHRLMTGGQCNACIFIDEVREKQIHFPLLGRSPPRAGNAVVAIKLANACGGTIVPTYMKRIGPARFKHTILPPIPRPRGEANYEIVDTINALNDVFEPIVLDNIEHWYMLAELRLPEDFGQSAFAGTLASRTPAQSDCVSP